MLIIQKMVGMEFWSVGRKYVTRHVFLKLKVVCDSDVEEQTINQKF